MFESKEAFAQSFKTKNPDYQQVPDAVLADKLLAKFPQYESQINPSYLGRVREQTKEVGLKELATGAVEGVKEGFTDAAERIGTRKGLIKDMPDETLGQKAKKLGAAGLNVLQSGVDVLARPVIGAVEGVAEPIVAPLITEGLKELPQPVQDKVNEAVKKGGDWFNSLDPMTQENLRSVGVTAEALPAGFIAKKGANVGVKAITDTTKSVKELPKIASEVTQIAENVVPEVKTMISKARENRVINNRVKELTNLQENNAPLRRVFSKIENDGMDIKAELAKTDLLKDTVDSDGTIRTQESIAKLNQAIEPAEDVVYRNLLNEPTTVPLEELRTRMKADVMKSGVKGGALKRALNTVDDEIEGYSIEAVDVDGMPSLPLAVIHEAKVDKYGNINYMNPESKKIDKRIAKTLKEIVEEKATTIDVKQVNNELKKFYAMQNALEALDGKKVKGGRLGKYTAQVIGATIGSQFGALGALAGAELGSIVKGLQMGRTFAGKTGKAVERGKILDEAIESAQSNSLGSRNINQSTTISPTRNVIDDVSNQGNATTAVDKKQDFNKAGSAESAEPVKFKELAMKAQTPDNSLTDYPVEELSKFILKTFDDKAGYALKPIDDQGRMELVNVFVIPEAQGQGLAKQVMFDAIETARKSGAKTLYLDAYKRLEGLYSKFRFKTVEELPFDPEIAGFPEGEDLVIMELNLR